MDIKVFTTPGLGDHSYLVVMGDEAALIDPQRDAWRFIEAANVSGVHIRYVLETHVHNDYVSGALETRSATGAEVVAPGRGGYQFAHRGVSEGDEVTLGDLRLVAMETPGHTPEHIAWALHTDKSNAPTALFTGGSLLSGSAGRTDLLGADHTDELTKAQFRTLQRLGTLPDAVEVFPTHGAGSFCVAAAPGGSPTSTIGQERLRNQALRTENEAAFVQNQLTGLMLYPRYYAHMAGINRAGPPVLGRLPDVRPLSVHAVEQRVATGAVLVDARQREAFADAHIPGSLNVELSDDFAGYAGWVLPFDTPLILVMPEPEQDAREKAVTQLFRIGWERIEGYLQDGVEAWRAADRPLRSYPIAGLDELCEAYRSGQPLHVLDARQPLEWKDGTLPKSTLRFVAELPGATHDLPRNRETWVVCASGYRAGIAASILDADGVPVRLVSSGGMADLLRMCPPRATSAA